MVDRVLLNGLWNYMSRQKYLASHDFGSVVLVIEEHKLISS